jgi:hypothetical protein
MATKLNLFNGEFCIHVVQSNTPKRKNVQRKWHHAHFTNECNFQWMDHPFDMWLMMSTPLHLLISEFHVHTNQTNTSNNKKVQLSGHHPQMVLLSIKWLIDMFIPCLLFVIQFDDELYIQMDQFNALYKAEN